MPTLVIQTAFLGDVILTTPLLTRLAAQYGPVDVLVTPAAAAVLEGHPAVREVITYDKRGADAGLTGLLRVGRMLRNRNYDRVYLPHRSLRSAALGLLSDSAVRIGFSDSPAALSYSQRVERQGGHETARLASLAGSGPVPAPALGLTDADRERARGWLGQAGIDQPFIAVAPGSVWATKRWPYYAELAAELPGPVVVVGGPDEVGLAQAIVARDPSRIHSAAGALPLRASAALIELADLLVTNDSAPLHLAGAVQTPVIAIFGPTIPGFGFGPLGATDQIAEVTHLNCRPCSRHGPMVCPLMHHRCMKDLEVGRVLEAIGRQRAAAPRPLSTINDLASSDSAGSAGSAGGV